MGARLGPAGLKEKKKYKSEIQMRRMNWNKVRTLLVFHSLTLSDSFHPLPFQLQRQQLNQNSFWVTTNEDAFASMDLFGDLEKTFGTGRGELRWLGIA